MNPDALLFFQPRPDALALYVALEAALLARFPDTRIAVQKTQISFYGSRLFACVSLPRRKRDTGLLLTFGLGRRADSPRIACVSEPYPGRFTHHLPLRSEAELDDAVWEFLREAYEFSEQK